jgi:hypothetical protein
MLINLRLRTYDQELLEKRVSSVLAPQPISEKQDQPLLHPPDFSAGGEARLGSAGSLGSASRLSPFANGRSPMSTQDAEVPHDMPAPLEKSSQPLSMETRLSLSKGAVSHAYKGDDLLLRAPNGDPVMRANVRKVDAHMWLEVAQYVDGSFPAAMVKLVPKKSSGSHPLSFFGPKTLAGHELFGPDGSFYGTLETHSNGGTVLVSSTTAKPVISIDGDMNSGHLTVRTPSGLELATAVSGRSIDICIHSGADLALIISSLLPVLLIPAMAASIPS